MPSLRVQDRSRRRNHSHRNYLILKLVRFLADENIPKNVASWLAQQGHEVIKAQDAGASSSSYLQTSCTGIVRDNWLAQTARKLSLRNFACVIPFLLTRAPDIGDDYCPNSCISSLPTRLSTPSILIALLISYAKAENPTSASTFLRPFRSR